MSNEELTAAEKNDLVETAVNAMENHAREGDYKALHKTYQEAKESWADTKTRMAALTRGLNSAGVALSEAIMKDVPYEVDAVDVKTKHVAIERLLKKFDEGMLDLTPDFQRDPGSWSKRKRSALIESIIMSVPLPAMYVQETEDGRWVLVDGLQRISTLAWYCRGYDPEEHVKTGDMCFTPKTPKMSKTKVLSSLRGMRFDELPKPLRDKILDTELSVHVIGSSTPDELKFHTFERINTGGKRLTGQEIRTALCQGPSVPFLRDLGAAPEFRDATGGKAKSRGQRDMETALRAISMVLPENGVEDYQSSMTKWLMASMRKLNEMSDGQLKSIRKSFLAACDALANVYQGDAPGKPGKKSLSKPLFEALLANFIQLGQAQRDRFSDFNDLGATFRDQIKLDMSKEDSGLFIGTDQATSDKAKVIMRHAAIARIICALLGDAEALPVPGPEVDPLTERKPEPKQTTSHPDADLGDDDLEDEDGNAFDDQDEDDEDQDEEGIEITHSGPVPPSESDLVKAHQERLEEEDERPGARLCGPDSDIPERPTADQVVAEIRAVARTGDEQRATDFIDRALKDELLSAVEELVGKRPPVRTTVGVLTETLERISAENYNAFQEL